LFFNLFNEKYPRVSFKITNKLFSFDEIFSISPGCYFIISKNKIFKEGAKIKIDSFIAILVQGKIKNIFS